MNTYIKAAQTKLSFGRIGKMSFVQKAMGCALLLFEIFNFDTSRFALENLIGDAEFMLTTWAAILAIAFCSIDSLSLLHMFGPDDGNSMAEWLLVGVWLIGATLNAGLTWWSISLIMIAQPLGNEVLSREQILVYGPVGLAALVLVTRVALIGALALTGKNENEQPQPRHVSQDVSNNRRPDIQRAPVRENRPHLNGARQV